MNLLRVTALILILWEFSEASPCVLRALQGCTCGYSLYNGQRLYVVNCTDTGFTETRMLESLPPETEVLIFTGNNIPELPWNVFGELDTLTNLTIIDMSNNKIREIKGKSYHHVANVQRLILNHNNLTISNNDDANYHHPRMFSNFVNLLELHLTDAFADNTDTALANDLHDIFVNSNLSQLYKLHLEQNEIRGFRDLNVFCDLPNLGDLYLGDNYLTGVSFNVSCLRNLRFIDLESNNISRLSARELDALDRMCYPHRNRSLMVDLGSNPFRCDGSIANLYHWLRRTNVTVRNARSLQCRQPRAGTRLILGLQHLFESRHARLSGAVTVLLAVLALVLASLLAALAYLSREKLAARARPLFDVVSRKVHYTTIESQDV